MKKFELTILGSNSAMPAYGRFPTSQVLNYNDALFLIDCGEGCQMRLAEYKIKRNRIDHIFISHLHGDHLYGLPGVITSFNHTSRKRPLTVYGPPGIKLYLETIFKLSEVYLNFDLVIKELIVNAQEIVFESAFLQVSVFPVYHRITCLGYLFREINSIKKLKKEKIKEFDLNVDQIKAALKGDDITLRERVISNEELTHPKKDNRSYAFCADSKIDDRLIPIVKGVDLLYFETTYLDDLRVQAEERGHSTAKQVGVFAQKAEVKSLVTGHYSSRYKDVSPILEEVKQIFPSVYLGYDGMMINI